MCGEVGKQPELRAGRLIARAPVDPAARRHPLAQLPRVLDELPQVRPQLEHPLVSASTVAGCGDVGEREMGA